jgi:hypothetical protein
MMKPLRILLGTGMCGLDAAVDVLNRQPGCQFSLSSPPFLPWIPSTRYPNQLANRLQRLAESSVAAGITGDAAAYYLPYIPEIMQRVPVGWHARRGSSA